MKCDILVVGCGGTGSHYVKELGRFLYLNKAERAKNSRIVLIDGDIVEDGNLARQAFLDEDIGRNKAEVMANILGQAFGIQCDYYDRYIDNASDLRNLVREDAFVLLVGCVDNHQCRQSMHVFFQTIEEGIYMDSANEYSVGEVVIGSRIGGVEVYPDRTAYFPDVLTDKEVKRSEESCEVLNAAEPQHLITNQFAALILLSNTVRFIAEEDWLGGIYYFDSFKCYSQDRTAKKEGGI